MVKSRLVDQMVIFDIEGDFSADEFYAEFENWLSKQEEVKGFIVDVSEVIKHPAVEQRKAAAFLKKYELNSPYAVVGKDESIARMVGIYERFTKGKVPKYFTSVEDAKGWVLEQA